MHYYVYVLYSLKDKKFYVGSSRNIKIRVESHFKGKVRSTVNRRPLKLILYECFFDKEDALKREIFLKSGFGRDQLRKALKNTLSKLKYIS